MVRSPAGVLLIAGFALAAMYAVVYFTSPSGTSGAFTAAPGAGHALLALLVVVLAGAAVWQEHAYKKEGI